MKKNSRKLSPLTLATTKFKEGHAAGFEAGKQHASDEAVKAAIAKVQAQHTSDLEAAKAVAKGEGNTEGQQAALKALSFRQRHPNVTMLLGLSAGMVATVLTVRQFPQLLEYILKPAAKATQEVAEGASIVSNIGDVVSEVTDNLGK